MWLLFGVGLGKDLGDLLAGLDVCVCVWGGGQIIGGREKESPGKGPGAEILRKGKEEREARKAAAVRAGCQFSGLPPGCAVGRPRH